jgi:hypothetical protein
LGAFFVAFRFCLAFGGVRAVYAVRRLAFVAVPAVPALVAFYVVARSAVKIAFFWLVAVRLGYFIESEKTAVFWGGFACGCCRA